MVLERDLRVPGSVGDLDLEPGDLLLLLSTLNPVLDGDSGIFNI